MTTLAAPRTDLVPLLALGSGIAVADNYYLQPLLALIGRDLGVGIGAMGVVSSLALLGYALGLLLVAEGWFRGRAGFRVEGASDRLARSLRWRLAGSLLEPAAA